MKIAEIRTALQPHQQRVVDRIQNQPGLVVAHGMGSGKTLTSIAAAERMKGPTTVLAPASLQTNYQKEMKKHIKGTPEAQYDIGSLQRAALTGEVPKSKLLTVDEAHRLRDPQSQARKAVREADTEKRLLLTGTPLYNRPYDLASLVNVAAGDNVFPGSQADFDRQYIGEKVTQPGFFAKHFRGVQPGSTPVLKNEGELGKKLQQWVDFHENNTEGFPSRQDEVVPVTMSPKQQELYDFAMEKAPAWVRYKVQNGLPPSKAESKELNAFSSATRQISNSPGGFEQGMDYETAAAQSPKIQEAFRRLQEGISKNPGHRALIYSNFLEAGLHPYETLLKAKGIPYGKFTGELGKSERDNMVKQYNEGALKALMLSSAGGEGLDLKGTRQIQVLDPHWNKEKIEQLVARGIRYKSHEHLPEDQRSVNVEHYVSQLPEPGMLKKLVGGKRPGGIDEYLRQMSASKDELNQQVRALLREQDGAKLSSMIEAYTEVVSSMEKQALIERLIRLGATDLEDLPGIGRLVKKTPRLFMKKRSPEDLASLQHGVTDAFDKYEQPLIAKAKNVLAKVPHEKTRKVLEHGATAVIKNPELALTELSPMPGTGLAWLAAKRGIEKTIDHIAPVAPKAKP